MKIIRREELTEKEWSGGTTTELAICPESAVYADRDFIWRLSSAVVRDEKSTFTALPDYMRLITTRKGNLRMKHDAGEWYELAPGQAALFDGASETVSEGVVTDFNLMLRKGKAEGAIEAAKLAAAGGAVKIGDLSGIWRQPEEKETVGIFVSDPGTVCFEDPSVPELHEGELVLFDAEDSVSELKVKAGSDMMIICIYIKLLF
ncbi:MAG: HutD family protein [Lachnospiraceae bacterium]|nr:HutD family protein [Lachnospiraceae bacterium]